MFKIILAIPVLLCGAASAVDAEKKKYCTHEFTSSVKKDSAACKAQYAAAVKDAGMDKEERKLAADELAECVKRAKQNGQGMMNSCVNASPY